MMGMTQAKIDAKAETLGEAYDRIAATLGRAVCRIVEAVDAVATPADRESMRPRVAQILGTYSILSEYGGNIDKYADALGAEIMREVGDDELSVGQAAALFAAVAKGLGLGSLEKDGPNKPADQALDTPDRS
jgi:hypothetical protein